MQDTKHGRVMDRKLHRMFALGTAAVLAAALSACGGGHSGGSDSEDISPGGFYTKNVSGTLSIPALITEAGDGWLIDDGARRSFALSLDTAHTVVSDGAIQLSGSVTAFDEDSGSLIASGSLSASGTPRSGLTLNYLLTDGSAGSYALFYQAVRYELPSSLALVAGTYSGAATASSGSSRVLRVTVDASGKLSGSDGADCTYSGSIVPVDAAFNAYRITGVSAVCGGSAAVSGLSGQALIVPEFSGSSEQLAFSISNAAQEAFASLNKVSSP